MKLKKVFFLSILCLALSGCTVEYNLDIKNATYKESIDITSSSFEDKAHYQLLKNWNIPAFYSDIMVNSDIPDKQEGIKYYQKRSNDDTFNLNMNYKFQEKEFADSTMAHLCYNNFFAYENDEAKTISYTASMDFQCFTTYEELEKVIVKLKTNRSMENHNADRVEGHTYIWEITRENALGKYIFFEMKKVSSFSFLTLLKYLLILVGILAIFGSFVIIYIRFRWRRANRI